MYISQLVTLNKDRQVYAPKGYGLSIIILTYNERKNLPLLVDELCSLLGEKIEYEIIIIDDASPDGTGEVAAELAKKNDNIKVISRSRKMSLASAIISGIMASKGDFVAVLDADLQHPPKMLPILLDKLSNGFDLVIASRYVKGGSINGWNPWRKFMSRVATLLVHTFLPNVRRIKDPLSGYFACRKDIFKGEQLTGVGYKLLLEILAKSKDYSATKVPYVFRPE